MDNLKKLNEERAGILKQQEAMRDEIVVRNGQDFSPEDCEKWDKLEARNQELTGKINTLERVAKSYENNVEKVESRSNKLPSPKNEKQVDYVKQSNALKGWLGSSVNSGANVTEEARSAMYELGLTAGTMTLPIYQERASLSTLSNGAGLYAVDGALVQGIELFQKERGGIINAVNTIVTGNGGDLRYLYVDDTAVSAASKTQLIAGTSDDPTFNAVTIGATTKFTGVFPVSNELIEDSAFDMLGFLIEGLGERMERTKASMITAALLAAASAGKVSTDAAYDDITYDDLVDLEASVDPAYWRDSSFGLNSATLAYLKKKVDTAGRPLWQAGLTASLANGIQETILGRPIILDQNMESMGAATRKVICFGPYKKVTLRTVGAMQIQTLKEKYAHEWCTGVQGVQRIGVGVTLPGAFKLLQMKLT